MKYISSNYTKGTMGLLLIGLSLFTACKKEAEVLTSTETPEKTWVLPQGNNAYDQRIVNYYNRFGSFILYKFTNQDINWNVGTLSVNYPAVQADEAYVSLQLDLLDKTFFKYYQDSTLRKYLPIKVFLCKSLRNGSATKEANAYLIGASEAVAVSGGGAMAGYQSFAVNWGRAAILTMSAPIDSVKIFKNDVNFSFLKMGNVLGKMGISENFINTSDYTTTLVATTTTERYKRGFVGAAGAIPSTTSDWYNFLRAVTSTSYTDLTNTTTAATDATYKGILGPLKDTNGLIRKKYDLMISYYKSQFNIDLQAIGNGG